VNIELLLQMPLFSTLEKHPVEFDVQAALKIPKVPAHDHCLI
jgi:hypothetical protein